MPREPTPPHIWIRVLASVLAAIGAAVAATAIPLVVATTSTVSPGGSCRYPSWPPWELRQGPS